MPSKKTADLITTAAKIGEPVPLPIKVCHFFQGVPPVRCSNANVGAPPIKLVLIISR
jgi:hypothetical protein